MEDYGPQGGASLDPRAIVGKIYVGDHQTLLYIKYISCGPEGYIHYCYMTGENPVS